MKVLVLGAGALGGYFGGKLLKSGVEVDFLVRPKRAAQLAARGLVVREAGGGFTVPVRTVMEGQSMGTYDVVLLTCKSYDLAGAIEAIAPAVSGNTVVLPLLNGVAHIATLTERFGSSRVLGGATLVYASTTPEGDIERGAVPFDGTFIGELDGTKSDRVDKLVGALNAAGAIALASDGIVAFMYRKLFGFSAAAILTTLLRARAGEIVAAPAGAAFVANVIDEISTVLEHDGFPISAENRQLILNMFSQPGSAYAPSIFRDMESGRPTEFEHTIGDLVRRGERHQLAVPLCRAALCNLQIVEQRRLSVG